MFCYNSLPGVLPANIMLPVVLVGIYLLGAAFAAPAPLPDDPLTQTLPNGAVVHRIKVNGPGQQIQLPGGGGQIQLPGGGGQIVMNGQAGQPQRIVVHRTVQGGQPMQVNGQPIQLNGQAGQPQVVVRHITQNGQAPTGAAPPQVVIHQQVAPQPLTAVGAPAPAPKGRGPLSPQEILILIETLSKNPNVKITRRPKPKGDIAYLSAKDLYLFLQGQGFPWPADMSTVPGFDPSRMLTIYLDQLYIIIEKLETFSAMPPMVIINILLTNPWGYVEVDDAAAPAAGAAGEGDNSYLANTGINRRQKCGRGLVDEAAEGIRSGVNGLVGSVATALGSGVLGAVGHGASALITHAISGIDFAIQDAACGLGNIANELAEALDTGDLLGGVGKIGQEFFGGVANMAEDLVSEAGAGVGQAAGDVFGFLQDLGK